MEFRTFGHWRNFESGVARVAATPGRHPAADNSAGSGRFVSGCSRNRGYPPEQEEVVAAQLAPERQKQPVDRPLEGVPGTHAAEFYGPAIRAVAGEHA
jgi:hypothetical protein